LIIDQLELPPLHILVPVWGDHYIHVFLEYSLPSLLADGNLPSLPKGAAQLFRIYTTDKDAETIRRSEIFQRLCQLVAVDIRLISPDSTEPHQLMTNCYCDGIECASEFDAPVIFLTADIIVAVGTFAAIQRQLAAGRRAVMTVGPRLRLDTVASIFEKRTREDGGLLAVTKRELASLAMTYMHPFCECHLVAGDSEFFIPANLIWRVDQAGLLFHCLHLHPLMVYPREKVGNFYSTIDDEFVSLTCPDPDDIHVVVDSDELAIAEVTSAQRVLGGPRRNRPNEVLAWAWVHSTPQHRSFLKLPIRYHPTELMPGAWQPVEVLAKTVIDDYIAGCERNVLHWLWHSPRAVILKLERWARGSALSPSGQIQSASKRSTLVKRICVASIDIMRAVAQLKYALQAFR
jgi:hypothetical protein